MNGLLFIISAPSGSGKSSLTNELRKTVDRLEFSISYTTRAPRGSEQDGREYFFVTRPAFEAMIADGEFLEYADVFGNYYGTGRRFVEQVLQRGNDLVLDIDVQGASQLKGKIPEAVGIFILPPSRRELEARLRRRSLAENVNQKVIERRLRAASREIENFREYDYILVNDHFETAVEQLRAIVLAERIRCSGRQVSAQEQALLEIAEKCRRANAMKQVESILASFEVSESSAAKE